MWQLMEEAYKIQYSGTETHSMVFIQCYKNKDFLHFLKEGS